MVKAKMKSHFTFFKAVGKKVKVWEQNFTDFSSLCIAFFHLAFFMVEALYDGL